MCVGVGSSKDERWRAEGGGREGRREAEGEIQCTRKWRRDGGETKERWNKE